MAIKRSELKVQEAAGGLHPLTLYKSSTVRRIFSVVVNGSLPISIGLSERPLGSTAVTRFGHFAGRHDLPLYGVELERRKDDCGEDLQYVLSRLTTKQSRLVPTILRSFHNKLLQPKQAIPMTDRKVALITGSGTGVGAATALLLAQQGYNIVINYSRSEAEAKTSQAACVAAGADTLLVQGDVADDAACKALAQAAIDRWGRLDALINNAGVSTFTGASNWDVLDMETFARIYAVNTVGAFQMVRACAPHLKAAKGSVVNVSSIAGSLGIGSSVPYIASKGALNSMTLYLARALAPDVRVNAVCPGLITSRWFVDGLGQAGFEKVKALTEASSPLERASTPQDVAEAIVWLTTGARTMTGELLLLDGGIHLGAGKISVPGRTA